MKFRVAYVIGYEKRDQRVHITMMYLLITFDYCTSLASIRYVTHLLALQMYYFFFIAIYTYLVQNSTQRTSISKDSLALCFRV